MSEGLESGRVVSRVLRDSADSILALTFWLIFAVVFLLSGMLSLALWPVYRMGVVALVAMPLLVVYGLRTDRVLVVYTALAVTVLASGFVNNSSTADIALFFRILAFSYLTYYLVDRYLTRRTAVPVFRAALLVALVQLPVVLVQLATYDFLPARVTEGMNLFAVDYDFGTFNFKGDSSMAFFVTMTVAVVLFQDPERKLVRWRWPILTWLSATVLIANSEIAKLALVITWVIYMLSKLNRPRTVAAGVVLGGSLVVLLVFGPGRQLIRGLETALTADIVDLRQGEDVDIYLTGGYARGAALYYYLTTDVLWLGDGPSRYSDPVSRERIRGNVGHALTFYSEVGIVGLLCSSLIFLAVAFPSLARGERVTVPMAIVMLLGIHVLSFTNQVMNDISVVLAYVLAGRSFLISPKPAPADVRGAD